MANHCLTNIRLALRYGLGTIIAGNSVPSGYVFKRTIRHIASPIKSIDNIPEFDAADIYIQDDVCHNSSPGSHTQSGANKAILENTVDVMIENIMKEVNDIETVQEDKLADLQAYFGNFYWLPMSISDTDGRALDCIYLGSEKFGFGETVPLCGIQVRYRIWYRQRLEDPTSLA